MKRLVFVLIALLSTSMAHSQLINVCGTDTIILEVENYDNKGTIEWQESIDTLNWVTIPEHSGEIFTFFPVESKYYRSVVKTSVCDPLYSTIAYVQLPPVAVAGADKVVGGTKTLLMGNRNNGDSGEWLVLSGEGGFLAEPNNPNTVFEGAVDQEYQLLWTVSNACGQSSDTVLIRFEELVLNANVLVVDNTDSLYSDSTEMATGIFRIKFSDPEINPYDSVLLLGFRSDQYFFQRVVSFTYKDSIYCFKTVQATLEDYIVQGSLNVGDAVNSYFLNQASVNHPVKVKVIESFPLRKDILENIETKGVLVIEQAVNASSKIISGTNYSQKDTPEVQFNLHDVKLELFNKVVTFTLEDFFMSLSPNFVCDIDLKKMYLKVGMENAKLTTTNTFKIEVKDDVSLKKDSIVEVERTVWTVPFMICGIPLDVNFDLVASFKPKVSGGLTVIIDYNYSNVITASIEKNNLQQINKHHDSPGVNSSVTSSLHAGIDFETTIGIQPSFTLAKYLKTYFKLPIKLECEIIASTDKNWSGSVDIGVEGNIGVKSDKKLIEKSKLLKFLAFDLYYQFKIKSIFQEEFPYRIENLSGAMQTGRANELLAYPIVFKVVSKKGFGVPFVRIYLELEDGHGSVNQAVVTTDITGQGSVYWTCGNQGVSYLRASVYDYENRHLENSPLYVAAFSIDYSPCENSTSSISLRKDNQFVYPLVTGGYPPYSYSQDGITYSSEVPNYALDKPGEYKVFVKDQNNCCVVRAFTIDLVAPCDNSGLLIEVSSEGNIVKAAGKGGMEPYQYSLNKLNDFSGMNTFLNLSVGQHTIYVKDANGCIASTDVRIYQPEQKAIKAIFPVDNASSIPVKDISLRWVAGNYDPNQRYTVNFRKQNEPPMGPPESDLTSPEYAIPYELDFNSTYLWEVGVTTPNGQLIDSQEFSFTSSESGATDPDQPVLYFPNDHSLVNASPLQLCWGKQQGEFVYDVYVDNLNATRRIAGNIEDTTYLVTGLKENETYFWKVVVKNRMTGESKVSMVHSFVLFMYGEVLNPVTGKLWMDRNLGAYRIAVSDNDVEACGDLYQWGRGRDGHEKRNSPHTLTLSSGDTPGHGKFICSNSDDWRSPQNHNLWQGVEGINNPCPEGFRIPTEAEWGNERYSWSSNDKTGAIKSPLKLPSAGERTTYGAISGVGFSGLYWSSTVAYRHSYFLLFTADNAEMNTAIRPNGFSVRCIKEDVLVPTVTTGQLTGITTESAVGGGTVVDDGGAPVTARGVVWSTAINPTVSLTTKTEDGSGVGSFTSSIVDLIPSTLYYVRAYATNSERTVYGEQLSFATADQEVTAVVEIVNPITGTIWMDRNLGATRAAGSPDDATAYGDLYQWGRNSDGHEKRNSQTTTSLSSYSSPGHSNFIVLNGGPCNWLQSQNNNLWQGVNGINNPCPEGFRLPTHSEWSAEVNSWSSEGKMDPIKSPLKLTLAGFRSGVTGSISNVDSYGSYWSSTVYYGGNGAYVLDVVGGTLVITCRTDGNSVRCIKQ